MNTLTLYFSQTYSETACDDDLIYFDMSEFECSKYR